MSGLDHRIPPPLLAIATAGAMLAANHYLSPSEVPYAWRIGVAIGIGSAAAAFGAPAFAAFGRAGTTINPVDIGAASVLVTDGIYRLTRNPMYVALTVLLLALAGGLGQLWLLGGPVFFMLFITQFQIIPEERMMEAKFGADFTAYRRRVRRWI